MRIFALVLWRWQGLVKGTVTQKDRDNPTAAIDNAVAKIFEKFPGTQNRT